MNARSFDEDAGFTLVEMMIAFGLFSILLMAVFSLLDSGTKTEDVALARQQATVNLRNALTLMTRDVRQATWIDPTSNTTHLHMPSQLDGSPINVVYDVSSNQITRTLTGGSRTLVTRIDPSTTPFCYNPPSCDTLVNLPVPQQPTTIRISLTLSPVKFGHDTVALQTDVKLRNIN